MASGVSLEPNVCYLDLTLMPTLMYFNNLGLDPVLDLS